MTSNNSRKHWKQRVVMAQTHDEAIKWKHFLHYWPFVQGIHRSAVNSPHKGQWRWALNFFFWSAPWINGWANNHKVGDLRRHRARYDINVMFVIGVCWHHRLSVTITTTCGVPSEDIMTTLGFRQIWSTQTTSSFERWSKLLPGGYEYSPYKPGPPGLGEEYRDDSWLYSSGLGEYTCNKEVSSWLLVCQCGNTYTRKPIRIFKTVLCSWLCSASQELCPCFAVCYVLSWFHNSPCYEFPEVTSLALQQSYRWLDTNEM